MTARFRIAVLTLAGREPRMLYTPFEPTWLTTIPKPAVDLIKKSLKIYPYTPGGFGTSIATALQGKVRLERNPPVPPTKFVEASGKSFNTVPPNDFSYFEMVNELVQMEPATSFDTELLGQLAAIGIVKGKPFKPDARMKKILSEAAAVRNAAGGRLTGVPPNIQAGPTTRVQCGPT
jgi:hypothetical protein